MFLLSHVSLNVRLSVKPLLSILFDSLWTGTKRLNTKDLENSRIVVTYCCSDKVNLI